MQLDHYLISLAAGFLGTSSSKIDDGMTHFSKLLVLDELGENSLSGETRTGDFLPFSQWIKWLRVRRVKLSNATDAMLVDELPPHIASAFAHSKALLLSLAGDGFSELYTLDLSRPQTAVFKRLQNSENFVRSAPEFAKVRAGFLKALERAEAFSKQNSSRFEVHFRMALLFLNSPIDGEISIGTVVEWLKKHDFERKAVYGFQEYFGRLPADFSYFEWSKTKIQDMLGLCACYVFGGMGSWNDQGFDSDEYRAVTEELYRAHRAFFFSRLVTV